MMKVRLRNPKEPNQDGIEARDEVRNRVCVKSGIWARRSGMIMLQQKSRMSLRLGMGLMVSGRGQECPGDRGYP